MKSAIKHLPIYEEGRDRMLMEKVKGVIPCPICKKGKVIAYESAYQCEGKCCRGKCVPAAPSESVGKTEYPMDADG